MNNLFKFVPIAEEHRRDFEKSGEKLRQSSFYRNAVTSCILLAVGILWSKMLSEYTVLLGVWSLVTIFFIVRSIRVYKKFTVSQEMLEKSIELFFQQSGILYFPVQNGYISAVRKFSIEDKQMVLQRMQSYDDSGSESASLAYLKRMIEKSTIDESLGYLLCAEFVMARSDQRMLSAGDKIMKFLKEEWSE